MNQKRSSDIRTRIYFRTLSLANYTKLSVMSSATHVTGKCEKNQSTNPSSTQSDQSRPSIRHPPRKRVRLNPTAIAMQALADGIVKIAQVKENGIQLKYQLRKETNLQRSVIIFQEVYSELDVMQQLKFISFLAENVNEAEAFIVLNDALRKAYVDNFFIKN
ncbi:hypothetical protein BC833DRAFT_651905 [Globomyces pollinis-pini]|nr:hypothetical protein BC833DRAFT_651905 [Globomyces pollinis-pini]